MIYYAPKSDIWVKCFDYINFSRASIIQFQAYWYIVGLNRTFESKDMVVSICLVLSFLILSISIYYAFESNIRMKSYDHLNFSRAFVVQFRPSQYIVDLNRTSESKDMAVWIRLLLWCFILRISIYYAPESDIRVKS